MLLDTYGAEERFWLITLNGPTSTAGLFAFRGDLIVLAGELNPTAGKRAPPKALIKQAAILASADKLHFVAGNFASIDELPEFIARFESDLAPECSPIFFVDNIAESAQVQAGAHRYILIQMHEGVVWNNLMDELHLDKGDLKSLSGEDKVVAIREAAQDHRFKYPERTLEQVLATKTGTQREAWGAV